MPIHAPGSYIRPLHVAGVTIVMILIYLHIGRNTIARLDSTGSLRAWLTGYATLVLVLGAAFTGYVLLYSPMSWWALVVITSMFSVVPYLGHDVLVTV